MPVDFLSAGQLAAYGCYAEPPSVAQLERFFHFDERDRALIDRRRGDHNRLGFAVQLGTVRFLGTFLARPADVPQSVALWVAEELRVTDPGCLADYAKREPTHREHAGEIQREYGYRDFSDLAVRAELRGWLDARAWATAERPSVLFDLATARLIEAKVLLPGATVLARAVASARDRAAARLHRTLAEAVTDEQRDRLEELLEVPFNEQLSRLEELRAGPRKLTASEVAEAFERLAAVRAVDVGQLTVDVPAGRRRAPARYGLAAKAQTLRRLSPDRQTATLLAALWQLEFDATDDALIVLDQVTGLLLSHAAREHKDRRYAQLPDLDQAARRLRAAVLVVLDPPAGGIEELWSAIPRPSRRRPARAALGALTAGRVRDSRRGRRCRGAQDRQRHPPQEPPRPTRLHPRRDRLRRRRTGCCRGRDPASPQNHRYRARIERPSPATALARCWPNLPPWTTP